MSVTIPSRQLLSREGWALMAVDPAPPLLAMWADTREVYALLMSSDMPVLVSTEVEEGAYPALSPARPGAAWFERMVHDLWGHTAVDGVDQRPWLDHGRWPHTAPMALRPGPPRSAEPPEFLLGEDRDQIPLGPVRGGIVPAAHLRLAVHGETIVHLETRLGYAHKGTLTLMRGKSPRAAARFAARLAAEATVAHSIAFARATEVATGAEISPRALALRDVMAAVEQIAGHLDVLSAMAEVLAFPAPRVAWHVETLRRAANLAFGHRLMMDCVIPGGVAADIIPGGGEALTRALAGLAAELGDLPLPPGAAADRAHHRIEAVTDGVRAARARLAGLPDGVGSMPLPVVSGEGIGFAKGPNGDIWHWLRLDHGQIASVFLCDPAWTQWPFLEALMAGGQAEDLPLVMAALGLSSSGMDL